MTNERKEQIKNFIFEKNTGFFLLDIKCYRRTEEEDKENLIENMKKSKISMEELKTVLYELVKNKQNEFQTYIIKQIIEDFNL